MAEAGLKWTLGQTCLQLAVVERGECRRPDHRSKEEEGSQDVQSCGQHPGQHPNPHPVQQAVCFVAEK